MNQTRQDLAGHPRSFGAWAAALATAACLLALSGCTTVLPTPIASPAASQALRGANLVPMAVGTFKLAPGLPPEVDRELSGGLRGGNIVAPNGSYSAHLKEILRAELNSAGLLDAQSKAIVEGQLLESKVDAAIGTGTARLAARFQVVRDGQAVFDKEVSVDDSWDSSFVGAVAIPRAIEHYGALYRSLIIKLVSDGDFKRALAR
jgi:hypothetical protein